MVVGIGLVVLAGGGAAWYFLRPKTAQQQPPTQVTAPAPSASLPTQPETNAAPGPTAVPAPVPQPRKAPTAKSTPRPAPPVPAPAANPQASQIASLQTLAREAYAKGNYAEPLEASAITLSKRVLAIAPSDDYAKKLLEDSVNGGRYQAQQAVTRKDFATAHRVAAALAQLLPGRNDVAELQNDITLAEKADEASRRPAPVAVPVLSFRTYHLHTEKSPADQGPYCLGVLSVLAQRMKFKGESASDGQVHNLDFACSEFREIKKNSRVASRQGGFHVRTASTNINFAPEDSSAAHVSALASACSK